MKAITKADANEKATENEKFKMKCKAELDIHVKQKNSHDENLHKACAETWERHSMRMKNKIETRSDCYNNIFNNPIKLLDATK